MALRVADEQCPFGLSLQIFCQVECSVKFVMLSIVRTVTYCIFGVCVDVFEEKYVRRK